jgi:hypothetical protein
VAPLDRHPFDPVSLVFGVVFVIAGIICIAGGEVTDEGRFLLPLGLIGLGVAVITQAGNRAYARSRAEAEEAEAPGSAGEDGPGDEVGAESSEDSHDS